MTKSSRVLIALTTLGVAACAPLQPPDRPVDPIGPGGELNATPLREAPTAELERLRADGLTLRGDRVEFEGELAFPPKIKGATALPTAKLQVVPDARATRVEARQSARATALANPRVRAALGDRFALLRSGWIDTDKGDDKTPTAPAERYQLTFYNYARNEVVTVLTARGREVIDVQSAPVKVQPAESREEVDAAVEIVRRDERYGRQVQGLRGRGIQTPAPPDARAGAADNDRYLYVMFYREPRTPAVFEATVNMSAGKVVAARPLR